MKLKISGVLIALSLIGMTGCQTPNFFNKKPKIEKGICLTEPDWALNPPVSNNKIYGVGIAPPNFNGEAAQRKSAISKAINEIASQLNTTVNSKIVIKTSVYNKSATHSANSISFQTVNGEKVSAKIIKSCKNPNNDYFYVLMETDK